METEAHAVISKAHRELRCGQPFLLDHTIRNIYEVLSILLTEIKNKMHFTNLVLFLSS